MLSAKIFCIMIIFLLLCMLCFVVGYVLLRQRSGRYPSPPELSGKLPIIGHGLQFLTAKDGYWEILKSMSLEVLDKGEVMKLCMGPRTLYIIADPEDFLTVSNQCLEKDTVYKFATTVFGNGLLTADATTWKSHYKALAPSFSQQNINKFINIFNKKSRSLVKRMSVEEGKAPFNHSYYMELSNLEVICKTAFDADIEEQPILRNECIRGCNDAARFITERFTKVWLYSSLIYYFSDLKRNNDRAVAGIRKLSDFVLRNRKAYLESKNKADRESIDEFNPIMDRVISPTAKKGIYTENDIRDEAATIITTGYDTVSKQMTLVLSVLGSHQNVQEKILEEIHKVFDHCDRDVTKEDLSKLIYTEAVLKETIRVYPIVPFVARLTSEDIKLKNYTLPAGTSCGLSIYGLHRHQVWGADADIFKPERWLSSNTLPDNPNAFAGFNIGRRTCIGKQYAMMSMKIMLVHIIREYRIKSDISNMKMTFGIIVEPVSGHHITIEKRS